MNDSFTEELVDGGLSEPFVYENEFYRELKDGNWIILFKQPDPKDYLLEPGEEEFKLIIDGAIGQTITLNLRGKEIKFWIIDWIDSAEPDLLELMEFITSFKIFVTNDSVIEAYDLKDKLRKDNKSNSYY